MKNKPDAKIGVLYQNDDYGKDYLKGLKDGLGAKAASMIVIAEESYETPSRPSTRHIVKLKSTGADVFINITTPKFARTGDQEERRARLEAAALPQQRVASTGIVMKPAGLKNAQGIISSAYLKDTTDPQWKDDAGIKAFDEFLAKYFPDGNAPIDASVMYGYGRRADVWCMS